MTGMQEPTLTSVPDSGRPKEPLRVPPTGIWLGFLRLLRMIQTLSGAVAIFMIPVLWGAWSRSALVIVLLVIFGAVSVFTLLSHVLNNHFRRGDL
jgi:hypothetical protein